MPNAPPNKEEEGDGATNKENKTAGTLEPNRKDFDKMVKNIYYQKGFANSSAGSVGQSS